jgi:hypothetical protein
MDMTLAPLEPTLVNYPDSLYCVGCKDSSDKGLLLGQIGCRLGALPRSKACIDKWGDKAPEWWVKNTILGNPYGNPPR